MRRIFLMAVVMVRIATGMSLGPMAMRATTPTRAISDQAKSNIYG
jgi:hypothetical protein